MPSETTEYLRIERTANRDSEATVITADVLRAVVEAGPRLGLPAAALIHLARAWLFVEGEDDRRVFDTLFGGDLRRAGIVVLRFHGAAGQKPPLRTLNF